MVMELSVGRAAQTSPLYMYEKLSGKRKWKIPGIVCLIGNIDTESRFIPLLQAGLFIIL